MGFVLIFAGLIFTLNPMLGMIDLLPDLIGFMLMYVGVSRLSSISVELEDALGYIKWAAIISLARLFIGLGSGGFDDTMVLCLSMVFSVLEFGVMLFALPALSDGLSYLNIRYGRKAPDKELEPPEKKTLFFRIFGVYKEDEPKVEYPEFKVIGLVFFAIRGFFSVLPQLSVLSIGSEQEGDITGETVATEWVQYSSMLTMLNVIVTLVVAVFWLLAIRRYIGGMATDINFNKVLIDAYAEKRRSDPGYFIRRRLTIAFKVLTVASFFLIDFIGDGVNYIPDFVFALLSLFAVWMISPYCGEASVNADGKKSFSPEVKRAFGYGAAYFVLSVISFAYCNHFASSRYFLSFSTMIVTYTAEYMFTILFTLAEGVALALYIHSLLPLLSEIAEKHVGLDVTEEFVRVRSENEQKRGVIKKKLRFLFCGACVVAASGVAFLVTLQLMPEYWMVHLVLNLALYILSVNIFSQYLAEIKIRYEKPGE